MLHRSIAFFILLSGVMIFSGCRQQPTPVSSELSEEAKKFKVELLAALSGAHRITVIEHSWPYDFVGENGELVADPPYVEYKRKDLTPELRTGFQAAFERMPGIPKTAFLACMFEPHPANF